MLFRGFSDTLDGEPLSNIFVCEKEGITFLYPAGYVELDTSKYKARMETRIDSIMSGIEYLQTLYDYTGTSSTLKVPQYIYQLKFDNLRSFDRVVIPDTLKVFSLVNADGKKTLDVKNEYIVNKNNPYYSTLNGMLTSKEQDKIYAIPSNMTKLTFDESIKSITISQNSHIKEIHLSSSIPEMDIENLNGAKIYVPANAYFDYLNAWGGRLGNNELLNEDESKSPYVYSNGAVYSQDMKTLYSITSDASGIFIVPESVETIATGAMSNCPNVDTLIFLSNIEKIEDKSINSEQLSRIYMLGKDIATSINENIFINSENQSAPVVYVQSPLYDEYVELWGETMGETFTSVLEKDELALENINGNTILKSNNGSILLKGGDNEDFDTSTLPIDIVEIGACAFKGNNSVKNIILGESVKTIGKSAFYNAQNLETLYSKRSEDIYVEANSFYKVGKLKYAAFNAEVGYVDDDFSDNQVSYKFYAPYNAYGYRNYVFDYETAYGTPYEVVNTNAGKILYAFNEYVGTDGGYVLCSATREISGSVKLKDNTLLICDYAFYDCANKFEIKNYNDIINIGERSFAASGISGKYDFESLTYIRTNAFSGCNNLTQLEFGQSFYMCYANIVSDCPNLKKLIIKSPMVPSLSNIDAGKPYSFGDNAGTNCGGFNIELTGAANADEYIDKWKYSFAGKDPFYDYGTLTDEEDIAAQNKVRALFGMSLLEYKAPSESETPQSPSENEAQNNSNSSANEENAENIALNNQNETNDTAVQSQDGNQSSVVAETSDKA
ncbi:MAG: leucine-rich repeat protein [Eubacteriales bacterium]|nr:leucine-rich repeat protein [Eubacteriales bacterium]